MSNSTLKKSEDWRTEFRPSELRPSMGKGDRAVKPQPTCFVTHQKGSEYLFQLPITVSKEYFVKEECCCCERLHPNSLAVAKTLNTVWMCRDIFTSVNIHNFFVGQRRAQECKVHFIKMHQNQSSSEQEAAPTVS